MNRDLRALKNELVRMIQDAVSSVSASIEWPPVDNQEYVAKNGGWQVKTPIPQNYYMVPIWAEENATLGASGVYEWAFGNGANTPAASGVPIYVPSGYSCRIVAMSLCINAASPTATVEAVINGTPQDAAASVSVLGTSNAVNSGLSATINDGDVLNFRTKSSSSTAGPCVVCAWLKFTETT